MVARARSLLRHWHAHALTWRRAFTSTVDASKTPLPPPGTADFTGACAAPVTTAPPPSIPLSHPTFAVWGADTDVGKTLVSAGLASAAVHARGLGVAYIKPVQTGWPADSDAGTVAAAAGLRLCTGPHAAELVPEGGGAGVAGQPLPHAPGTATTLFGWRLAAAPCAAVEAEGRGVSDDQVASATAAALAALPSHPRTLCLVETAGGPASPGPSGSLQADAWRPLRLPPVLVASPRLGGVSSTLAAAEALALRGHGPPGAVALVQPEAGLPPGHVAALERHLAILARAAGGAADPLGSSPPRLFVLPPCGRRVDDDDAAPGAPDPALAAWLAAARPELGAMVDDLLGRHARRLTGLAALAPATSSKLWFPFTQHGSGLDPATVTTIDARAGEHLLTWSEGGGRGGGDGGSVRGGGGAAHPQHPPPPSLTPLYDGCAAWWTQGVAGPAGSPLLPLAVGAAIGRYGHVIHPRTAAAPVLAAAESLLSGPGAGWAGRVFFSDDGSTAVEVGLKMAFRASAGRRAAAAAAEGGRGGGGGRPVEATVLAVAGGYHGDTLGAMCATAPSLFNGDAQTPWYAGRGLFLDPPTAGMEGRGAGWVVRDGRGAPTPIPGGLAGLFSPDRLSGPESAAYEAAIGSAIDEHERGRGGDTRPTLSAALFEPVLMGAGGMVCVDPAWHAAFVRAARSRSIPVVADEVFTGLWRLGAVSGCALLGLTPDIGCYAKLLTGGAVPLAATLATAAVFDAFTASGLAGALLHGHSYSAHAAGCAAAAATAAVVTDPAANPAVCAPGRAGCCEAPSAACTAPGGRGCGRLAPLWDARLTASLADHPSVARVAAIGTVLAVQLRAETSGYGSTAAAGVAARLREGSSSSSGGGGGGGGSGSGGPAPAPAWGVYARPLGDVLYLMLTPTSVPGRDGPRLQAALLECLA